MMEFQHFNSLKLVCRINNRKESLVESFSGSEVCHGRNPGQVKELIHLSSLN